jgi:hypothetical protein
MWKWSVLHYDRGAKYSTLCGQITEFLNVTARLSLGFKAVEESGYRGYCSGCVTDWTPEESWFDSRQEQQMFFFSMGSRSFLGSTQTPVYWVLHAISLAAKWPARKTTWRLTAVIVVFLRTEEPLNGFSYNLMFGGFTKFADKFQVGGKSDNILARVPARISSVTRQILITAKNVDQICEGDWKAHFIPSICFPLVFRFLRYLNRKKAPELVLIAFIS